jgi:hypothetical protein
MRPDGTKGSALNAAMLMNMSNAGGLSPQDAFSTFNVDFNSVTAANNNPDFGVRIVSIFSPQAFDQNAALGDYAAATAYMRSHSQA